MKHGDPQGAGAGRQQIGVHGVGGGQRIDRDPRTFGDIRGRIPGTDRVGGGFEHFNRRQPPVGVAGEPSERRAVQRLRFAVQRARHLDAQVVLVELSADDGERRPVGGGSLPDWPERLPDRGG